MKGALGATAWVNNACELLYSSLGGAHFLLPLQLIGKTVA